MVFVFNTRISVSFALLTPYLWSELKLGRISWRSRRWLFANSSLRQGTQYTRPCLASNPLTELCGWCLRIMSRWYLAEFTTGVAANILVRMLRFICHCQGYALIAKDYPFDSPKFSPRDSSLASVAFRVSFPMHPKQKKYLQMANVLTNLSLRPHRDLDSVSSLSKIQAGAWSLWQSLRGLGSLSAKKGFPDGFIPREGKPCELPETMANCYFTTAIITSYAERRRVFS